MAPWCLFDFTTKEVSSTDIALGHLPLEATYKKLDEEEAQLNCFDGSCIQGFSNTQHQDYNKT